MSCRSRPKVRVLPSAWSVATGVIRRAGRVSCRSGLEKLMADKRADRFTEFIKPLQVKPESKVNLAKDFDPGYKLSV
jgi:hypothetical protein